MRYILIFLLFLFSVSKTKIISDKRATNFFHGTKITQIVPWKNEIWFATAGKGLIIYDKQKGTWSQINSSNSNLRNDIIECLEVSDDFVWCGGTDGLSIMNRRSGKWEQRKFSNGGIYGLWVRSLYYDSSRNVLWIGRFTHLTRLDVNSNRMTDYDLTRKKDAQTTNVKSLWMSDNRFLWAGTEAGLHKIDVNRLDKFETKYFDSFTKGFANNSNYASVSVIKNYKNTVYVGLAEFYTLDKPNFNRGGLFLIDQNDEFKSFDKKSGLIANGIYSLDFFGNYIALGTYEFNPATKAEKGTGLSIINRTTGQVYNIKAKDFGIINDRILNIYFDGQYLWLGTFSGISRINLDNGFVYKF